MTEDGALHPSIKDAQLTLEQERFLHQTIKKVTEDIDSLNFNTAISQMMIFVNEFLNLEVKPRVAMETFVLLLSPFAPHVAEEIWSKLGHSSSLAYQTWPSFDNEKTKVDMVELVVQVNGKVRSKIPVPVSATEDDLKQKALQDEHVRRHLDGKEIMKTVVVKNKLISFVVK